MKRLLLLLLFLTPTLMKANSPYALEGRWYDYADHKIRVKVKKYGLKVKGLHGISGWRKFEPQCGAPGFIDCDNNVLYLNRRGELVFEGYRDRYRVKYRKDRRYGRDYGYERSRGGYTYSYGYGDDRDSRYNDGWSRRVFYAPSIRKGVEIEDTREGVRVRLDNQDEWTYYRQHRYKRNEYTDTRGNRIVRIRSGHWKWTHRNGWKSYNIYDR